MSCQTSAPEVLACVTGATGLYLVTFIPLMRLARADHLTPRCVRELPAKAAVVTRPAAVSVAALLMLIVPSAPESAR